MKISKALHTKMARFRKLKIELDQLQAEIKEEVLEIGETVRGDGICVTFTKPRHSYDYVGFCDQYEVPLATMKKFTKSVTDWRAIALDLGIEDGELEDFTTLADNPSIGFKIEESPNEE